jgi:hypothetical protein
MPRVYDLTDLSAERAAVLLECGDVLQGEYHEALIKRYEADLKFSNALLKEFTTEALRAELAAAEVAKLKARPAGLSSPVLTSPKAAAVGPTPLAAVPFLISTTFDVMGHPTTAGNDALALNVVVEDAAVVSTLKAAGAVLFGSTNTHELNLGMTTRHHSHGLTKNVRIGLFARLHCLKLIPHRIAAILRYRVRRRRQRRCCRSGCRSFCPLCYCFGQHWGCAHPCCIMWRCWLPSHTR